MVQFQTFPLRFEQNLARTMPAQARTIVHRIARDIIRSTHQIDKVEGKLELGHAKLHMQLHQRFGQQTSSFVAEAHEALDNLVHANYRASSAALPLG